MRESLGSLIRENLKYVKTVDGKPKVYRKLKRDEVIEEDAMQSWCYGELHPIKNTDGETIGDTPSSFSDEREFYNPIRCSVCNTHLETIEYKESCPKCNSK